jgi:Na+-transporting methylmalonyl-CoA/oxaloacetate decarboxylase gamma subunit
VTLHNAIWVWGGTVMLALFALAFLFLIHGQGMVALGLFFGANVIGILVWLLTTSFRRAYPPEEEKEENSPPLLDRLNEEE